MTSIIFVRHGESNSNVHIHKLDYMLKTGKITKKERQKSEPQLSNKIHSLGDPKLSEIGQKQATCVGKYLHNIFGDTKVRVLTSLFTRTIQTSVPFKAMHENDIVEYESTKVLCEYTNPKKNLTQIHRERGLTHHSSWTEFTDTIKEFVDILEQMIHCNDAPIVVFGHSLFISAMISYIGSSKIRMPDKSELKFRLPNCSITTLLYSQEVCKRHGDNGYETCKEPTWKILNVASIAHLSSDIVTGTECPFGNTPKSEALEWLECL